MTSAIHLKQIAKCTSCTIKGDDTKLCVGHAANLYAVDSSTLDLWRRENIGPRCLTSSYGKRQRTHYLLTDLIDYVGGHENWPELWRFLNARLAARKLGIKPESLKRMRVDGYGPRAIKFGKRVVRYRPEDIESYLIGHHRK